MAEANKLKKELDLLKAQNLELKAQMEDSVPKSKLSIESIVEKVQWWYHKNNTLVQSIFWLVLTAASALIGITVAELTGVVNSNAQDLVDLIQTIAAIITGGTVAGGGLMSLGNPKKAKK